MSSSLRFYCYDCCGSFIDHQAGTRKVSWNARQRCPACWQEAKCSRKAKRSKASRCAALAPIATLRFDEVDQTSGMVKRFSTINIIYASCTIPWHCRPLLEFCADPSAHAEVAPAGKQQQLEKSCAAEAGLPLGTLHSLRRRI